MPRDCGAGDTYLLTLYPQVEAAAPGARSPVGISPGRAQPGPEMRSPSPAPPGAAHLPCHLTLFLPDPGPSPDIRRELQGGGAGPHFIPLPDSAPPGSRDTQNGESGENEI